VVDERLRVGRPAARGLEAGEQVVERGEIGVEEGRRLGLEPPGRRAARGGEEGRAGDAGGARVVGGREALVPDRDRRGGAVIGRVAARPQGRAQGVTLEEVVVPHADVAGGGVEAVPQDRLGLHDRPPEQLERPHRGVVPGGVGVFLVVRPEGPVGLAARLDVAHDRVGVDEHVRRPTVDRGREQDAGGQAAGHRCRLPGRLIWAAVAEPSRLR
jgi:hypothetical protein